VIIELYGRLCDGRKVFVLEIPNVFVVHGRKSVPELLWVPGDLVVTSNADDQEAYYPYCELPDRFVFLSVQSEFTKPLWDSCKVLDPCVAFTTWRDWRVGLTMCATYQRACELERDPSEGFWRAVTKIFKRQEGNRKRRAKKRSSKKV
jgi:hypothetical protein